MSLQRETGQFTLGVDLGVESIGWALLSSRSDQRAVIDAVGSHTFDPAVEGDVEAGRDESRAKARRDARQPRRQHDRRARRRLNIARILQQHGLLPKARIDTPGHFDALLKKLDASLRTRHIGEGDRIHAHLLPYILRAKGLDEKLELHEVGRAVYHLAQRRGFLSNRKSPRDDKEEGVVNAGISVLHDKMKNAHARTLGEYFASLDPEVERIRQHWTSRQMYEHEFEEIWSKQVSYHATLTDALKKELHGAIFYQRPLKSQKHLIAECELMPGHKHAPVALRIAQQFRMLQKVNDLEADLADGTTLKPTLEQRRCLIDALDARGDLRFTTIRSKKILNLPKGTTFNHERGGEKTLPGNRTDAALAKIFGDRWESLTENDRDQVVEDVLTYEKSEALVRRAKTHWGLDDDAAAELGDVKLEQGYSNHCRQALRLLVSHMEDGTQYATVRRQIFPESFEGTDPVDMLPPVLEALPSLRNPAVCRALTELRKVVNEIIRKHGKPHSIHVELARDLKRPRKQRVEISNRNLANRKAREGAKKRILEELGDSQPSRSDIEKVLLADECNWTCPYTGKSINMRTLLGNNPQFDIEHILPMSRSLDNGYMNKTLCYHEENRTRKHNLTPFEAYSGDSERWSEIIERVRRFHGDAPAIKLRRFKMEEIPEDFTLRQLNDTRYASRLAADYLGLLYGGRSDSEHHQRIFVNTGGITAHLRNVWMLNSILDDGGMKTRNDHRHHAVDAITIALSTPSIVKRLSDAARQAEAGYRRPFTSVAEPWAGFLDEARKAVLSINVSRRTRRQLAGPLHKESLYSKPIIGTDARGKAVEYRHIRKPLAAMSTRELDKIVDPIIRRVVRQKLDEIGGEPKKAFAVPENHPVLTTGDGRRIPIHGARIRKSEKVVSIAHGARQRYVTPGSNHHMVIVAHLDKEGADKKWVGHLVPRLCAVERARRARMGEPVRVVQRGWPEGQEFRFTLAPGEMFRLGEADGATTLYVVRSISKNRVEYVRNEDARLKKEIKGAKDWKSSPPNRLRELGCRKVTVTYFGEIRPAND